MLLSSVVALESSHQHTWIVLEQIVSGVAVVGSAV